MTNNDFLPPTADELAEALQQLKERALRRIDAHFASYPAPVNNIERPGRARKYLRLLRYHVPVTEESQAFITALRPEGFRYELHFERNGREPYATLGVAVLIELVRLLEKAQAEYAQALAEASR